ncbi:MAG TPA: hypothetical protein VGI64_23750 [Streptosporangiaceae bacterium]
MTSATASSRAGHSPGAESARGWAASARALLRQHWLAAALLTAGLVLRVLASLAYRPALFYIDSPRYLYNAEGMDPVGYKGPLRTILLAGNFDTVAAVQHLLGLGIAVVIYLLLLRRGVSKWLAALAIAPVLLDAYQLQDEQAIMPGTWFEALIVAGIAILLWRPSVTWRRAAAAGAVLGTAATVGQVGEILAVPAVVFLLVAGGRFWRAAGRAAALGAAFALPILLYCTISFLATGDFFLSHQGDTSLYGRTAAAADCATLRLTPAERGMCPTRAQQAKGADSLEFGQDSPIRAFYNNLPRAETDSLISNFNKRVLTQQPQRLLDAYGRDVIKIYALTRVTAPGDAPISRWQFQSSFPYLPPHITPSTVRAMTGQFGGGRPRVWRPVASFLRGYQLDGGYAPGPLLLLCTVAGVAGSLLALRRKASARSRQLALASLLMFATAVALTLVSDLFVFSWRYQLPLLVTLVPAGALGISAVVSLRSGRSARRAAAPPRSGGSAPPPSSGASPQPSGTA